MQTKQTLITLIICVSCLSSASDTSNWSDKEKSSESLQNSKNKPKFSDFHDLKIHENDEKTINTSNKAHSRQKRLIWITDDGRLALPPGTSLTITPTLALPFVRYPPDGFFSNISVSLPVTLDFDKLGLTDNQNPLGVLPPLFARQMGRAAGSLLGDYVNEFLKSRAKRRMKRELNDEYFHNEIDDDDEKPPKLPESHQHAFHGGERALLYTILEDFLETFGVNGKACLLRAICEVHAKSVTHLGLVGEMMKLFLTASQSPYSSLLEEYVTAEKVGKGETAPAECFPYHKECPKSLFKTGMHKYRKRKEEPDQKSNVNKM